MSRWQDDATHLTWVAPDLPMERRQRLWEQYHVRASESPAGYLECLYLLPAEPHSLTGSRNQAVNTQQIIGVIVSLCTLGFTRHSRKARTLWFAIKVANDLGVPYRIHVRNTHPGSIEYALVRQDWQPGLAESATGWQWWASQPPLTDEPVPPASFHTRR